MISKCKEEDGKNKEDELLHAIKKTSEYAGRTTIVCHCSTTVPANSGRYRKPM